MESSILGLRLPLRGPDRLQADPRGDGWRRAPPRQFPVDLGQPRLLGVAETDGAVLVGRGPGGRGPSPGSPEAPTWRPLAIGLGHRSTCLRSSTQREGAGLFSGREPAQVAAGRGNRERLHCGEPRDFRRPAGPSTSRTPPGLGRPPLPVPEPPHVPANPPSPAARCPSRDASGSQGRSAQIVYL